MNRIQLPVKQLFIKVENIVTPYKSYQVFNFIKNDDPITVQDLINRIREHYGFIEDNITNKMNIIPSCSDNIHNTSEIAVNNKPKERIRLELWSGPIGSKRIRLDCSKHIPDKYDTIWVRGYINQENPKEENQE